MGVSKTTKGILASLFLTAAGLAAFTQIEIEGSTQGRIAGIGQAGYDDGRIEIISLGLEVSYGDGVRGFRINGPLAGNVSDPKTGKLSHDFFKYRGAQVSVTYKQPLSHLIGLTGPFPELLSIDLIEPS